MPPLTDPRLLRSDAYVDGAWTKAGEGKTFAVRNPATGGTLAEVADLEPAGARAAIEAAAAAFPAWSAKTAKERAAVLRAWFGLIMAAAPPCTSRATMRTVESGAQAQAIDDITNRLRPMVKSRRLPR